MQLSSIGDFVLDWGESLVWDDRRQRLYFIDFLRKRLCWLEDAAPPLRELALPMFPTGVALADDGRLLVALDDGLYLLDVDNEKRDFLAGYPAELGKRVNDMTVDPAGNLVTGSLNIGVSPGGGRAPGSYWRYASDSGWRMLDDDITNANGPVCVPDDEGSRLIFADTPAQKLFSYAYDPEAGAVEPREVFADVSEVGGFPDGACATSDGDILSCVLGRGVIAHYDGGGLRQLIDAGSEQPSDICFGGPDLDRVFIVSIRVDLKRGWGAPKSKFAGRLLSIENAGLAGVPEHRFRM